jgi:hypothetical protein
VPVWLKSREKSFAWQRLLQQLFIDCRPLTTQNDRNGGYVTGKDAALKEVAQTQFA